MHVESENCIGILARTILKKAGYPTESESFVHLCAEDLVAWDSADIEAQLKISRNGAEILKLAVKLGLKLWEPPLEGTSIQSSQQAYTYIYEYGFRTTECVFAIFLDSQNQVLANKEFYRGTKTESLSCPSEIIRQALLINASQIVLGHNHPSGVTEPSQSDDDFTLRSLKAADLLGLSILDHLILGRGMYFSYHDNGELGRLRTKLREV